MSELPQLPQLPPDLEKRIHVMKSVGELSDKVEVLTQVQRRAKKELKFGDSKLLTINNISKSVTQLLARFPSGDAMIDKYILEIVVAVRQLSVFKDNSDNEKLNEDDSLIKEKIAKLGLILNRMLNKILEISSDEATLNKIMEIEKGLEVILYYAEDDKHIIECEDDMGWKKNLAKHKDAMMHAQD